MESKKAAKKEESNMLDEFDFPLNVELNHSRRFYDLVFAVFGNR